MPRLAHSTLQSSPDENGNTHRLDIDPRSGSGKKHSHVIIYLAKIFSYRSLADPRDSKNVVGKFSRTLGKHESKQWAKRLCKTAKETDEQAEKLNNMIKNYEEDADKVKVIQPQYVSLDAVSWLDKSRSVGEFLIFEDRLKNFTCFVNSGGQVLDSSKSKSLRGKYHRAKSHPVDINDNADPHAEGASPAQVLNTPPTHSPPSIAFPAHVLNSHAPEFTKDFTCPPYYPPSRPPTYEESEAALLYGTFTSAVPVPNHAPITELSYEGYGDLWMCPEEDNVSHQLFCSHLLPTCPDAWPEECSRQERQRSDSETSTTSSSSYEDEDDSHVPQRVLQAFIHHFFCDANGKKIIANLRGRFDRDEGYILTTPTIHSLNQSYGERDEGPAGIKRVIDNHTCSRLCRHLPDMHQIFERARRA